MELSREDLGDAYRRMRRIRAFEEKLEELVKSGKLGGFLHLYAGEEAVAVGVCANLTDRDIVTSTHRGHGHCIAKGVEVKGMMAELFGRSTGVCKGRGGSMHIADVDKGMLGANGIVGSRAFPLATGAGLTAKVKQHRRGLRGRSSETVPANQGQFHESLNMASNWKLPVVYVLENNGYRRVHSHRVRRARLKTSPSARQSYAMRSEIADGMDFFDVYEKAATAIALAREGEGPTLLECKTYRFMGHFVGDPLVYRPKEEAEDWIQNNDPLLNFEAKVTEAGLLGSDDLRAIDGEVQEELAASVEAAEAAPLPQPADMLADVYVES